MVLLILAGALSLAGCGQFFTKLPVTTTTTTTTADNLYIGNSLSATQTIAGFAVGTSLLTPLTSSPYAGALGVTCVALTPNNNFLYVGTVSGGILLYTVNTDGSLTLGNGKVAVATGIIASSMVVDPSGAWLIVSDELNQQVLSYSINASTGVITNLTTNRVALTGDGPTHMRITPNGQFIYVPEGTAGVDILGFNATTGALSKEGPLTPLNAQASDQAVATDPNGAYLFVAETGNPTNLGLRELTIGANGALTEVTGSPFATGVGPSAVLVDSTGGFVYVANSTSGNITGYSLTSTGVLTALTTSPFAAGARPIDMVEDKSKSYIAVLNSGGNPDLQLLQFDATSAGKLDQVATAATGTDPASALSIAATH